MRHFSRRDLFTSRYNAGTQGNLPVEVADVQPESFESQFPSQNGGGQFATWMTTSHQSAAPSLEQSNRPLHYAQDLQTALLDSSMNVQATPTCALGFDYDAILGLFGRYLTPLGAEGIVNHLQLEEKHRYFNPVQISNSQAFVFPTSAGSWGVMLWKEGEMEILRLFLVDGTGFVNMLTHYGRGKESTSTGKQYWESAISWQVNHLNNLKMLWIRAQHLTWTAPALIRAQAPELRSKPFALYHLSFLTQLD